MCFFRGVGKLFHQCSLLLFYCSFHFVMTAKKQLLYVFYCVWVKIAAGAAVLSSSEGAKKAQECKNDYSRIKNITLVQKFASSFVN